MGIFFGDDPLAIGMERSLPQSLQTAILSLAIDRPLLPIPQ